MNDNNILAIAQDWLNQDPDAETRAELQAFIDAGSTIALQERFAGRLQFGTAGLRGPLQAGPLGMNRVLIAQAARGLALYLQQSRRGGGVVIGCDARKNSAQFAQDCAEILQGTGIPALLLPPQLPTPVLAYAVRSRNADAGIMITASHNPPNDNGCKIYLGGPDGGSQIIPPADADIAACIDQAAQTPIGSYPRSRAYQQLDDTIAQDYIAATAALADQTPAPLQYVYTPMHGVGKNTFLAVLEKAGYPLPALVAAQSEPDPAFPTVQYPNPEEHGALDLAIAAAKRSGANFLLANDPDADRLAAAICSPDGTWQILHGNTIGLWLAWETAKKAQGRTGTLACSLVSSPLLGKIAAAYGLAHQETLTGFKWISRAPDLLYGYEEALGYLVDPDKVRDKDGISAAVAFLNLALHLQAAGQTFSDYAAAFAAKFGAAASAQVSLRYRSRAPIDNLIQALQRTPHSAIAGLPIASCRTVDSNILIYRLQDGDANARIIYRPSGTESKLKIYLDTDAPSQQQAEELLQRLKTALERLHASTAV